MFNHLPSLKAIHAFESAARHSSFNAAATELSVSAGAISYQIKQLESNLGVSLFHRQTRQVVLTHAGQQLYHTAHRLFRELTEEVNKIVPATTRVSLTISVSTYFVTRWLSPRLGKFLNAHPDITICLQHAVNDPDFAVNAVDLAIRWGDGKWPGTQSKLLLEMPMIAVCSPALLDQNQSLSPQALQHQPLLYDQPGIDRWPEWLQIMGVDSAMDPAGPVIVDPNVRVQAAIDGHGLVLGNPLLQTEINSGALCEPFDKRLQGYGYYLVSNSQAQPINALKHFVQWLHTEADQFSIDC